jgi:hypothetical protein
VTGFAGGVAPRRSAREGARRPVGPELKAQLGGRDPSVARWRLGPKLGLGTLFDRLIVKDGAVVEYTPRPEYAAEVIALVDQAIGPSGVVNAPAEYGWRAKGRPRVNTSNGGKGGIRTLEGALHPLPA